MTLARWNPISDVVSLREAMDRLFEDSFIRPTAWTGLAAGQLAVPVDLWETKDAYHLRADLPGLKPEDIEINATSDMITLSGETKTKSEVSDEGWIRQERRHGKFTRSFALPVQIDPNKVEANFNHGVLEMTLQKAENVKPRAIKINATAK
ncbi:MAG TPA: Hsp20/alpha crystallin family protein [Candidatus Limnocylindria bacterium]|jgi:HSP20 family protein|nr:Hsp20/alpha crystallin family protein [Candidatus Limnocylindria bacterium]